MDTFTTIAWLTPWQPVSTLGLVAELQKEVAPDHPLYQFEAVAIGQRCDCDDVLFFLPHRTPRFAVVHLTWSGKAERTGWPTTTFYESFDDWVVRCMQADHRAYCAE
jgi:hypothetical protein